MLISQKSASRSQKRAENCGRFESKRRWKCQGRESSERHCRLLYSCEAELRPVTSFFLKFDLTFFRYSELRSRFEEEDEKHLRYERDAERRRWVWMARVDLKTLKPRLRTLHSQVRRVSASQRLASTRDWRKPEQHASDQSDAQEAKVLFVRTSFIVPLPAFHFF